MAIVVILKTIKGERFELPITKRMTIGRSSKCDLTVSDSKLSGQHCYLEISPHGKLHFKDLDSTNGSSVNGTMISHHDLKIGEKIFIGDCVIYIDESRLSALEKAMVGRENEDNQKSGLTLPGGKENNPNQTITEKAPKKSHPLDDNKTNGRIVKPRKKEELKKLQNDFTISNSKDRLIEQEESSGNTQFLKLEVPLKKKK